MKIELTERELSLLIETLDWSIESGFCDYAKYEHDENDEPRTDEEIEKLTANELIMLLKKIKEFTNHE